MSHSFNTQIPSIDSDDKMSDLITILFEVAALSNIPLTRHQCQSLLLQNPITLSDAKMFWRFVGVFVEENRTVKSETKNPAVEKFDILEMLKQATHQ